MTSAQLIPTLKPGTRLRITGVKSFPFTVNATLGKCVGPADNLDWRITFDTGKKAVLSAFVDSDLVEVMLGPGPNRSLDATVSVVK